MDELPTPSISWDRPDMSRLATTVYLRHRALMAGFTDAEIDEWGADALWLGLIVPVCDATWETVDTRALEAAE